MGIMFMLVHIGTSNKIRISWESSIFVTHFRKWNPHTYSWQWNIASLYFLTLSLWLTDNKKPKIHCLRKLQFYTRSIKKGHFKQKCQTSQYLFVCIQYLVGPPFAWITAPMWHGGNQLVALRRCDGSPGCFDSGLLSSALLGLESHLPLDNAP